MVSARDDGKFEWPRLFSSPSWPTSRPKERSAAIKNSARGGLRIFLSGRRKTNPNLRCTTNALYSMGVKRIQAHISPYFFFSRIQLILLFFDVRISTDAD